MDQEGLLDNIKNEPVWHSYLDDETNEVHFYNRVTKEAQKEKPKDYDGYYVIGEQSNEATKAKTDEQTIYDRTFGDMSKRFCTPMELAAQPLLPVTDSTQPAPAETSGFPILGQWEEVKEEDQFENRRKAEMRQREEEEA